MTPVLPRARPRWRQLAILICIGLTLAQPLQSQTRAGGLPSIGDSSELTPGAERRLGERYAREIYRDPDYIDDPILAEYVDGIWRKILIAARERGELTPELDERFAWEIMMGRDRSINAFAMPGGYLGLHLGLLGLVSTRDEIAAVLAHELSHVTQRHISRLMSKEKQQLPWVIGALILSAMVASKRPDAATAIAAGGQAVAIQGQLNFSRDMEREADRIGYAVLEQAGYETRGFSTMFDKLQQAARLNDYGNFPYLRTHPLTTERIADMTSRDGPATRVAGAQIVDIEHLMMAARARALSQQGVDGLRALAAEAEVPRFEGLPAARQAALRYQAALASMRLNDLDRAKAHSIRLRLLVQAEPVVLRLAEMLKVELELAAVGPNSGPASAALADSLRSSPLLSVSSDRRPELLLVAQLLMHLGRADEASQRLRTRVVEYPRDAAAWELLARSNSQQGLVLRSIRAQAEAHVARYDYTGAMDRFAAAQDLIRKTGSGPGLDHLEASIIDARARRVATLAREQALER